MSRWYASRLFAAANELLKIIIQPACEAGGQSTSPRAMAQRRAWGSYSENSLSLRSWRQMATQDFVSAFLDLNVHLPPTFVGLHAFSYIPQAPAAPSPGASTLSASFAGSVNDFFGRSIWCGQSRAAKSCGWIFLHPLKTATPVRSQLLRTLLRFSVPPLPWLCARVQRLPSIGPPSFPKFPYTSNHQRPGMIIGTTRCSRARSR